MAYSNSRFRRVTEQQLELLWEFLNSHRDLAVAYNRTLRAKYYSKCKWEELATTLNAQGNGAFKNWKGWSKYWVDYKAKLKKRVVAVRASRNRTGGGPATEPPLSFLEMKFIGLMGGNSFAEGLPGVRVEPILPPRTATPQEDNTNDESVVLPPGRVSPVLPIQLPRLSSANVHQHQPMIDDEEDPGHQVRETPTATNNIGARRRVRSRAPILTMEAARREILSMSRENADTAERGCQALETIAQTLVSMQATLERIER